VVALFLDHFAALLLFGIFISPYVIDPLFNKYEPLSTKAPQLVPSSSASPAAPARKLLPSACSG